MQKALLQHWPRSLPDFYFFILATLLNNDKVARSITYSEEEQWNMKLTKSEYILVEI